MKKRILIAFLQCTLLFTPISFAAQSPDAELKRLEAYVEELANTSLPDFASEIFRSVRAKVREARAIYDKEGRVPQCLIVEAREGLKEFHTVAKRTQKSMGKSYELRNASLQFNFARSVDPGMLYSSEQTYQAALKLAREQKFAEAERLAGRAKKQFQSLIKKAKSESAKRISGPLTRYRRAISSDLASLSASSRNVSNLKRVDGVSERIRLEHPRISLDLNGDGILESPYWEPPPEHLGPPAASAVIIEDRTRNSVRLSWGDRSDNETGTRVLRSTDLFNWVSVAEKGPIPKLTWVTHTDPNLTPGTRYCYKVESFNAAGALSTLPKCTYTRDEHNIPIWRLQLRVKVADFNGAGTDSTPRASIGDDGRRFPTDTYLDYGRDDFERGSDLTYDLNIGEMQELSDITDLALVNYATGDNLLYVEEIALIVNYDQGTPSLEDHTVFYRHFGTTANSALPLSSLYRVDHSELRSDPLWQNFVARSKVQPFLNVPKVSPSADGQFEIQIPADEIVSRIESFVGHMLHADEKVKGLFKWGFVHGAPVEVSHKNDKTLHVDLDLEATINNWPNPELDMDFDVEVKKRCDSTNRQLIIELTSKEFTSSADSALWRDITTFGFTTLTDRVVAFLAEFCAPLAVEQSFAVPLPPHISCEDLQVKVNSDATASVCCFGLNP